MKHLHIWVVYIGDCFQMNYPDKGDSYMKDIFTKLDQFF